MRLPPSNPARCAVALLAILATLALPADRPCLAAEEHPATVCPAEQNVASAATLTILLRQEASCPAGQITLADIAALSGPTLAVQRLGAVNLGPAPTAGKPRQILRSEVDAALAPFRTPGLTLVLAGATKATVSGPGTLISGQQLAQAATEALQAVLAQYPGVEAYLEVLKHPAPLTVEALPYELKADLSGVRLGSGPRTIRVGVIQEGARVGEARVLLQLRLTQLAAVARERIAAGEPLSDRNLEVRPQEISALAGWRPAQADELRGRRARQAITAGRVVEAGMLELVPVIGKGDRVTLTLTRSGLELKADAEALTGAIQGQFVRLRLLINNKEVVARASGPGQAQL